MPDPKFTLQRPSKTTLAMKKKYIDAEKLNKSVNRYRDNAKSAFNPIEDDADYYKGKIDACKDIQMYIASLQQEQPDNMIQWTGSNLQEVIDFTGKSPRFGEWFNSWEDYENYVHTHNGILKLFCEDGSHYEVPIGAWIVKTPDGYNLPSVSKYIQQEKPEVDLEKIIGQTYHDGSVADTSDMDHVDYENIARHFYELGLNARKEENK